MDRIKKYYPETALIVILGSLLTLAIALIFIASREALGVTLVVIGSLVIMFGIFAFLVWLDERHYEKLDI